MLQPRSILEICIFVSAVLLYATAQEPNTCSRTCTGLNSKFKYKRGSSYSYKYDSQTNVQLVGNSKNVATVGLKADVLISVIDTCEFVLKISGAALSGPSAAQIGFDLVKDLEKFPLAFSFDNGAVRDICPSKDDTVEALNIKRAILSSFQIANDFDAEVSYESDISGHCPARQTLQGGGGSISVTKTKNLLECRDHFHFYSSVRMVPYHVRSHVQNPPTYKANQECKFNIQNNVLRDSSCKENHDYVPFRNEKSGAGVSITVTSKLTFSQEGKATGAAPIVERQSLLYDDQNIPWRESKDGITKARETLQILCKTASNDVRPDTASHFVEFVHELKITTLEDLRILAKETKSPPAQCKKFRQFVLDGVAQCGTTACVSLLTELLTKKSDYASLSQMEEKFALGNLALTARPTKAMITSLTSVLENLPQNGMFATTALVNNYCRLHKKCQEKPEVKSFVKKYVGLVSRLQLSDKGPENIKAVETLRAFGNLGSFTDGIKERLSFLDKSAHIDAKLAAVQSLRRAPCTSDLEEKLFNKYIDNQEDTEVRISTFLVLMHQCADKELISRIVNSSDNINSNQVGSFVQTYFANTRASADPSKNKPAFARAHLTRKFPSDPRKHSRHFHYSDFNYDYNLGSHADAVVLYEPEYTFPKQASINLTIDYFGNEINLLEFGVRAENFDKVYDSFFGPEGYLTNPKAAYNKENRKIAVKNPKVAEFQSLYDKEHKPSEDLDFGAYMRVFGDELFYSSAYNVPISELMGKFTPEKIVKTLGKEKVRTIAVHRLPFDHHATVPVISGFPLRYDGNVTVVINLDLVDMVNIGDLPNGNAEVKLTFKPSANVETAVVFGIYTGAVKNGVRISRSSHTSTALEFALKLSNRDNLVAKLNLPKERQELAKVSGKIETIINNVPIEEKGVVANRGEGSVCTPKKLGERIGLKLCTVISYPNSSDVLDAPYFPLTGPFNAEVYIDKTDPGVSSYELAASWKANKDGRDVIFSFDTPKSQVNRKVSLTSKYIRQKSLDLEYKSPKRIITAKGVMEGAGPDNTAATFNVGVDGKVYEVKANVIRSTSPGGAQKYQVTGNVKSPDKPSVGDLKGTFDITPGAKFVADASVTKLFDKPITYKATYSRGDKKYMIDHDFNSPWYYRKIKGNMNYRGASDLDYSLDVDQQCYKTDPAPHKFTYTHNHSFKPLGASSFQLTAGSKFSCSKYPSINGGYDVNVDKKPQRLTAKVNTIESGKPGLSVESLIDMKPYDYAGNVLVRYPNAKVNKKISAIYRNSMPTEFEASAKLEDLEAKKEVQAVAKLKKEANSFVGDYLLHLRLPQAEYKVSKNVKSTGKDQYLTETTILYPPNKKIEIKSSITGTLRDYKLKSNIIIPDVEPMDYEETLKYSQDGGKWSGLLKKSGKVIFDANSDFNKGGDKKTAAIRIKLPTQNIDYGLESTEERVPSGKRIVITSKRNGKDYSKLDVSGPEKYLKDSPRHETKLMSTWDLDTSEPKEIGLDSSVGKASRGVDADIVFRIKAPKANYKFQLSQKQSDQMWTNMTILKNDAVILKSGIGIVQNPQSGQLDYSYQTFAPMTPYDMSASISYQMTRELYKAGIMLANKLANRKLNANLEAKAVKEGDKSGFDKSVTIAIDNKQAVLKNYAVRSANDAKAKGQLLISGQVYKWDLNKAGKKIDAVIETPIPNYEKVTFNGQKDEQGKKTARNFELGWSKNKIKANSLYEFDGPENDITYLKRLINLETSFDVLKVLSYEVSQDYRKGIDAAFKFDLNKQHKFSVSYMRTTQGQDEKWNTGLSCKMGANVDWETQSSADWNAASGKYSTHNLVRTSPKDEYKADLDLDTKTMEAKVNLVNVPGVKTPVKGQAKKVGDEEYEVSLLDSAGVNQGKIVFKLASPAQKLRLETSAFKAGVATEWTGKKWSVAGDIVPDAKTNKAYSIELAAEASDAFTRALRLAVGYPERKVGFTSKRSKKPDGALNHVLEIGSNIGKRSPTKLEYSLKRVPTSSASEFHLNDPSIPAGVHLTSKYYRVPGADPNVDKSSSAELSFKYSADPKKELIFKRSSDRQITGDKMKLSQSYEMIHDASNIKHKIWGSYNAEPCHEQEEICDRSLFLGAQYPDEKRALQEYSLDLKRSGKVGEFATKVGQNKYKIVRKKVTGGQRTYEFSRNDQPTYTVASQLSKWPQPMAFLSVKKPTEDKIILSAEASLANDELATLKLNHDENGQLVRDIDVAIWLKESNRLAVRVFRRNELTKAFTDMANNYVKMLPTAMPKTADLPTAVRSQQLLAQDVTNELKPLYNFYDKEEDAIAAELQITSGKLSKVLADEMNALTSAIDYASGTYTTTVKTASDASRKFADDYKDSYRNVMSKASDLTSNVGGALSDARKNVEQRASKARAAISGVLDEFGKNEQVQKYIKALTKFYKDLTEGPIYQRLRNLYRDATEQVGQEAKGEGFTGETMSTLRKIRIQKVKQLGEMWEQIRAEWSKDDDYKDLVTFFDAANAKLQWAVQYTDPYSKGMRAYKYLKDSFVTPAEPQYMFNKSADGQSYNMEVNLPYSYNSLKDLACDVTPDGIIGRLKDVKESVEDALDSLSGADDTGSKESIGLVVGDQYFITFDGTVRTFTADCSYLLARDYIDSRFTVSVEFERGSRKKIVVEYEDQKIEILKDGKVAINGKNADLPWHLEDAPRFLIKVVKGDEYVTTLETFDGLKVECNTFNDICAIKLKNRFRGKTNGLLGRNDGESYTDLLLPDGSSAKSLDDYAAGWALNAGCAKSPNAAKTQAIAADHPAYKECEKLFHAGHWSPFRKCAHLNFDDFMIICSQSINQYVQKEKDETKINVGVCQTAAAYLAACPQGTDLPPQCVQCDIRNKINLHATKRISGDNLNDVDVVLAVELRECMSSVKNKLATLATKIEANLKSKGKDARFGVAGFSGSGGFYEPAFFSDPDNKVNFQASNVKNIAGRLPFYSPPVNVKGIPSPNNPLDIVDFVTEHYPFRPASKKVIVVLACSNCVTFELSYYDLHTKLLSQGYTLYIVTTQSLQLGESKEKFIGFDASAFIKSDSKPNTEARKDLVEPHDSCTVLAQETNGTVFSIAEKSNIDPVFNVLSMSVGKTIDNACNLCECRSHDLYPRSVCFACEPPQPAVVTADKTGFFNNPFVKLSKLQNKDQQ